MPAMKPVAFTYYRPASRAEAIALLVRHGGEAKILAGGQSLLPAMNFRVARPSVLIDVNRVPHLDYIRVEGGQLRIGALARHAHFERPLADGPLGTLLPRLAACIGPTPIRSRGTFGGSLANADPASEWCCVARALGAEIIAAGPSGERTIPVDQFFTTAFATALGDDELLTEIRIPHLDASWSCGFAEYTRRSSGSALAMAAVAIRLGGGVILAARIGLGGTDLIPMPAPEVARVLVGASPCEGLWAEAAHLAAASFSSGSDIDGSADHRRDLVAVMLRRALRQAAESERES
jgi:carbon-monoxide dehydrogenase medium subunit